MASPIQQRTKLRAQSVLLDEVNKLQAHIRDEAASEVLTSSLVAELFEVAWRHQFDEDRSEATKQIREKVDLAIDSRREGTP